MRGCLVQGLQAQAHQARPGSCPRPQQSCRTARAAAAGAQQRAPRHQARHSSFTTAAERNACVHLPQAAARSRAALAAAPRQAAPAAGLRSGSQRRGAGCALAKASPRAASEPAAASASEAAGNASPSYSAAPAPRARSSRSAHWEPLGQLHGSEASVQVQGTKDALPISICCRQRAPA